jgi:hypothetical protein
MNAAIGEIRSDQVEKPITLVKRLPIGSPVGFRKCRKATIKSGKPIDANIPHGTAAIASHHLPQRLAR